jgi:hypothetical protein
VRPPFTEALETHAMYPPGPLLLLVLRVPLFNASIELVCTGVVGSAHVPTLLSRAATATASAWVGGTVQRTLFATALPHWGINRQNDFRTNLGYRGHCSLANSKISHRRTTFSPYPHAETAQECRVPDLSFRFRQIVDQSTECAAVSRVSNKCRGQRSGSE